MRLVFLAFISFFILGCAKTEPKAPTPSFNIYQKAPEIKVKPNLTNQQENFKKRRFAPWQNEKKIDVKEASWAFRVYNYKKKYYAENKKLIPKSWFDAQKNFANFENFLSVSKNAITIKNTNLRNFATNKPIFLNFNKAGEGFPFDYLQNSVVLALSPVFVSHFSKDLSFAFVQTDMSWGFVDSRDIEFVDTNLEQKFINANYLSVTKDNRAIYEKGGKFAFSSRIGQILPILRENNSSIAELFSIKDKQILPLFSAKDYLQKWPLDFNNENISKLTSDLLGKPYGWGGFYENRDCSMLTRDLLSSFGIWLPRNSKAQKNTQIKLNLKNLPNKEKKEMILRYAIPFFTLLYMPGHIMLYAGEKNGEPLALQDIWGLRTMENENEGRLVFGKTLISDLNLGDNLSNLPKENLQISKITHISIPTRSKENALISAYKSIVSIEDNIIKFDDNSSLIYDDLKDKTALEKLENPDIEDMLFYKYPALKEIKKPENDPGRARNEEFFKKLYGKNKQEVKANLTKVIWLPNNMNIVLLFNTKQNAAKALQNVSNELDKLPKKFMKYLKPSGTFIWRHIFKTKRLSAHSFGIAIDIDTKYGDYWNWSKNPKWTNKIPEEIVQIFEKHGFIWGGRWSHYDTFHFEYRPEFLLLR